MTVCHTVKIQYRHHMYPSYHRSSPQSVKLSSDVKRTKSKLQAHKHEVEEVKSVSTLEQPKNTGGAITQQSKVIVWCVDDVENVFVLFGLRFWFVNLHRSLYIAVSILR